MRGRFHPIPRHPHIIVPGGLTALTADSSAGQNLDSAGIQAPGAVATSPVETQSLSEVHSGLRETKASHE